jgi:hypothetical protein
MLLQLGPISRQIDGIQIISNKNSVGVADVHAHRVLERTGADYQMKRIHFTGRGDVLPGGSQFTHLYGHLFFAGLAAPEQTAQGVDHHLFAFAFLHEEPPYAREAFPQASTSRRFYNDQFIAPHAFVPAANPMN